MSRLLRTLLLGLLKLLLQLIILAVTGRWVQIGRRQSQVPSASKGQRKRRERARPGAAKGAAGQRPIFERRALGEPPTRREDPSEEAETLEEWGASREAALPSLEALLEEGSGTSEHRRQRPPKRRRRKQPPALPPPQRSSLARALQDPHAIRRAILVGSAVAPRRR